MTTQEPLIGIPACRRLANGSVTYGVSEKYIRAIVTGCGAMPVLIPAIGGDLDVEAFIGMLDGLVLTGGASNVEPHLYGGPPSRPGTLHDAERDATTIPLIKAALRDKAPVLAVCRGIQELNVALGGTLHQNVQDVPGCEDHRSPKGVPWEIRFAPAHKLTLTPGGKFEALVREGGLDPAEIEVNSLHAQAIDQIAPGIDVEARAKDGVIEAVTVSAAPALGMGRIESFVFGTQWHPEYNAMDNQVSRILFGALGAAAHERKKARAAYRNWPVANDRQPDAAD